MTAPPTFLIHDAAGNTFGPAEAPSIVQRIRERRITPEMTIAAVGDAAFIAINTHPLFAAAFQQQTPIPAPAPLPVPDSPPNPPTCGYAVTAFLLAASNFCVLPVFPALLAIFCAFKSLRRQKQANASGPIVLGGRGLAHFSLGLALAGFFGGLALVAAIIHASIHP